MSHAVQDVRRAAAQPAKFSAGIRRYAGLLSAMVIALVASVAYLPALHGGFILDDDQYLTDNPLIASSDGLYRFWCTTDAVDFYPVTNTTLWLEWRLWGLNPTGYHITNLALFIAECLLIGMVLRRLAIPGAFLAALLFAVHPVNVESVAWISQRKNLLAGLFFLLAILSYLKSGQVSAPAADSARRKFSRWYWLSLLFFTLAMLSKGSVVVLPAVLLLIAWWQHGRIAKADLLRTAPFFLMAMLLTPVIVWFAARVAENVRDDTLLERLLGAGAVVWFYLAKALVPIHLIFVYPQWHIPSSSFLWWLPLLAAGMLTASLWRRRNASPPIGTKPLWFTWAYFCLALVPVMGFSDTGYMQFALVADHYQHLALIGAMAAVAAGWSTASARSRKATRSILLVGAAILLTAFVSLTWRQNRLYAEAISLYQDTLKQNPRSWMPHCNLGMALNRAGRTQEAIEHYTEALRLKPDDPTAHYNFGNALAKLGRFDEAIEQYRLTLQYRPEHVRAHFNLANQLAKLHRTQEAIEVYRQTVEFQPDFPDAHNNFGNSLFSAGRTQEAIEQYQQALEANPNYADAHYNLAKALEEIGWNEAAVDHYQQAVALKPDNPAAYNSLGYALLRVNRATEAIVPLQEAVRLKPDDVEAYANLALVYSAMQRPREATAVAHKAMDLARARGQAALAQQIDDWLQSGQQLPSHSSAAPSFPNAPTTP